MCVGGGRGLCVCGECACVRACVQGRTQGFFLLPGNPPPTPGLTMYLLQGLKNNIDKFLAQISPDS